MIPNLHKPGVFFEFLSADIQWSISFPSKLLFQSCIMHICRLMTADTHQQDVMRQVFFQLWGEVPAGEE